MVQRLDTDKRADKEAEVVQRKMRMCMFCITKKAGEGMKDGWM